MGIFLTRQIQRVLSTGFAQGFLLALVLTSVF